MPQNRDQFGTQRCSDASLLKKAYVYVVLDKLIIILYSIEGIPSVRKNYVIK